MFHRFKMLAVSGALILAALLSSEPAKAQDKISIAAIVNDEVVSVYDLAGRITLAIASARAKNNEETRRRIAPQVLKGLIEERIKLQEAKRLGLAVGEEEVNQALQQIEKQNDLSSGGLENFLLRQGIAKATLVDQIESSIAWAKVVNTRMRAGIVIGDDEIDETLARIKESEGKPQQRISEIFLPINNPDQEVIVRQSAERIIEQLKSKARFESLARNFSQSASAAVGGDLGWTRQGELGGKLDAVVATLRPGEISPPIRTPGGYQIFMVKARRADPGLKGAESFLSLQTLVMPIAKSAPATDITTRMNEAKELTSQARNCPELDALGKKNNLKLSGNIGRVRAGQLPPEFQEVIRTLAVDVPSSPVRRGETIVVLMVCEREAAAPQVDPRQQVRQSIMRQRLNAAAQRYLRDLRRAAFVDVKL